MSLGELLGYVAPEYRGEVERRFHAFAEGTGALGEEHIDSFAQVLHERGFLTAAGLHDFLTYRSPRVDAVFVAPEGARYQRTTPLAEGGMGEIFLGSEPTLRRTVALKRLKAGYGDDPTLHRRFVNEAQLTAQLDHPAIVPVYGFEREEGGAILYAMKLVRGVTLSHFIEETVEQTRRLGRPDAAHSLRARVDTLVPVLNAIAYAHKRGVIHRDLKPENVMVGRFGEVLVMDWGLARLLSGNSHLTLRSPVSAADVPRASDVTQAGAIVGTPDFMPPEQARGELVDAAADQYALGLVLQELVTLRPARDGNSSEEVIEQARRGQRKAITQERGGERVPRELRAIIDKATAFAPRDRYPSVEAMADDVRRFLRDEAVLADPDSGLRRVQRWVGRHRGGAVAVGLGLVLMLFVVAALFVWRAQVALEEQRLETEARERQVMALAGDVERHASRMLAELHRYELLLAGIVTSARVYLDEPAPPTDAVIYRYAGGAHDPPGFPPEAVDSVAYRQPTSLRHGDLAAAVGVDRATLRPLAAQLVRLEPVLRDALLASAGDEARKLSVDAAETLVLGQGVPLSWAYVGTAPGLSISMPATWEYADSPGLDGYDFRRESWYADTLARREPFWESGSDESGMGLLLTCALPIRALDGRVLGVAALDLTPARFIDAWLDVPGLAGAESLLLDRQGRVQVRSSQREIARSMTGYAPVPWEESAVVEAMRASDSGHLRLPDGRLALWTAVGQVGLSFVVIGPEATILSRTGSTTPARPDADGR